MNMMNGVPVYCKPAARANKITSGLDYEDFRATMIAAKKAGLIVDGPETTTTNYTPKIYNTKLAERKCVVCNQEFKCKRSNTTKACSQKCTRELQARSAKLRVSHKLCPVCKLNRLRNKESKSCSRECSLKLRPPQLPMCPVCGVNRLKCRERRTCSLNCSNIARYEKNKAKEETNISFR